MTILHVCTKCGKLSEKRRCPEHRRRVRDKRQKTYSGTGARGRAWRRARAEYLRAHPYCERGCGRLSRHVHHKDGKGPLGPRGLDPANFEALCVSCHSAHEVTLQPRDEFGHWAPRGGA